LLSCYGDEVLTTLESVAINSNSLDVDKLYNSMQKKFIDPETPYQVALAKRPERKYPIDGPWLNGGLIKCFENYAKGIRSVLQIVAKIVTFDVGFALIIQQPLIDSSFEY